MTLSIEYVDISTIKAYKRNSKRHPAAQVEQIAASISEFGMNDPIAVCDNVIIEGHGRYLACKKLNMQTVPILRLDHLTDEQRRAYNIVHNKLCMNSDFDLKILSAELDDIFNIDMSDFGFDVDSIHDEWEEQHEDNKQKEKFADANILNLERAQYPGVGDYDIPKLNPVHADELQHIDEWIGFNYVLTEKNPENKAVHFFLNDYQFERIWNNPEKYIDKLSKFAAVATPDFSPYGDMPFCLQLYNHYRKHWVGAYLQEHGIKVIPTIRASTDPRSSKFYLEGEPEGGVVLISSMWTKTQEEKDIFINEYNTMYDTLKPEKVFIYGKQIDGLQGDIERIKTFTESRFKKG